MLLWTFLQHHYPVDDSKIDAAKNAARLYVNAAAGMIGWVWSPSP